MQQMESNNSCERRENSSNGYLIVQSLFPVVFSSLKFSLESPKELLLPTFEWGKAVVLLQAFTMMILPIGLKEPIAKQAVH